MTLTFAFKDIKGNEARASYTVDILDEPVISNVTPAQGAQTGENKKPTISAEISNAGENASVTMTVNSEKVDAVYADGKVTYTPAAAMADGKVTVTVTVKRADKRKPARPGPSPSARRPSSATSASCTPTRSIPTAPARWKAHWIMSRICLKARTSTSSHSPTIPTTSTARITPTSKRLCMTRLLSRIPIPATAGRPTRTLSQPSTRPTRAKWSPLRALK